MSDDRLMQELAKVARAEKAAAEDATDPRVAKLAEPLSMDELDLLAERTASPAVAKSSALRVVEGGAVAAKQPPARARRGKLIAMFAAPLALAAAVVLFIARGSVDTSGVPAGYELVVEGAGRDVRSGTPLPESEPVHVDRGGRLTLLLRPRAPSAGAVGARAMIEHDGALRAWSVPSQVSPEGVVRIDATGAALADLPPGSSTLVLFVGATSHLPADAESAKRAMTSPSNDVESLSRTIVVSP